MFSVSLSGLRFNCPLGLYPQEQVIDNCIEINLKVRQAAAIQQLPFIDYTMLHDLITAEVALPETLLENLLSRIVLRIEQHFPGTEIDLSIRKLHPPFGGEAAYAEVRWQTPMKS